MERSAGNRSGRKPANERNHAPAAGDTASAEAKRTETTDAIRLRPGNGLLFSLTRQPRETSQTERNAPNTQAAQA